MLNFIHACIGINDIFLLLFLTLYNISTVVFLWNNPNSMVHFNSLLGLSTWLLSVCITHSLDLELFFSFSFWEQFWETDGLYLNKTGTQDICIICNIQRNLVSTIQYITLWNSHPSNLSAKGYWMVKVKVHWTGTSFTLWVYRTQKSYQEANIPQCCCWKETWELTTLKYCLCIKTATYRMQKHSTAFKSN